MSETIKPSAPSFSFCQRKKKSHKSILYFFIQPTTIFPPFKSYYLYILTHSSIFWYPYFLVLIRLKCTHLVYVLHRTFPGGSVPATLRETPAFFPDGWEHGLIILLKMIRVVFIPPLKIGTLNTIIKLVCEQWGIRETVNVPIPCSSSWTWLQECNCTY